MSLSNDIVGSTNNDSFSQRAYVDKSRGMNMKASLLNIQGKKYKNKKLINNH